MRMGPKRTLMWRPPPHLDRRTARVSLQHALEHRGSQGQDRLRMHGGDKLKNVFTHMCMILDNAPFLALRHGYPWPTFGAFTSCPSPSTRLISSLAA